MPEMFQLHVCEIEESWFVEFGPFSEVLLYF